MSELTPAAIREIVREEIRAAFAASGTTGSDALLTIEDVTNKLSISKTTLWELRRQGKITGHTVGRRVLFKEADVEALVSGDS